MDNGHLYKKKIFVTGATGFVGRHVVAVLLEAGAEVTCLARASSETGHLNGCRLVRGDLRTGQGLSEAVRGQDMVVHLAALLFGHGWRDYLAGNGGAAENLGRAVKEYGESISRFLFVSSLSATGPSAVSPGVNDFTRPSPVSAYGWSKFLAENILGRYLGDRLVTLRPPIIYGPHDRGLLPYFKSAKLGFVASPGLMRTFPISLVHVEDMARAVLLGLLPQASGVYHLNDGREYTMASLGRAIARSLGRKAVIFPAPLPIMAVSAALSGFFGRFCARQNSWNYDKYLEARENGWLCDSGRIQKELGYVPRVFLEEGIAGAVKFYTEAGWL